MKMKGDDNVRLREEERKCNGKEARRKVRGEGRKKRIK
jgi:hypothetical protein